MPLWRCLTTKLIAIAGRNTIPLDTPRVVLADDTGGAVRSGISKPYDMTPTTSSSRTLRG